MTRPSTTTSLAPGNRLRHALRQGGWFAGKTLTTDWTTHNFVHWARILEPYRDRAMRVLEIGSYEGRSALFFLNYMPNSRIVCVDPFDGGEKELDPALRSAMADVERRFDQNLAPFALRCEKRKGRSVAVLPNLAMEGYRFELIYVDGDHRARNVYNDAALSWPLLVTGGIIIFDDYQWDQERPSEDRPQLGIDSFLEAMKGHYRDVHRGYQIIVEKL